MNPRGWDEWPMNLPWLEDGDCRARASFENILFFETHYRREEGEWSWAAEYVGSCALLHGYVAGGRAKDGEEARYKAEEWAKEFLKGREASKLAALLDFVNFARSSGQGWF